MSKNNPYNLKVGQELFYVNDRHLTVVTITKVGRIWAELSPSHCGRIELATLLHDNKGYGSRGRCWLSEDEYKAEVALGNAWSNFRHLVSSRYARPEGLTVEDINQALKLVKLNKEEK